MVRLILNIPQPARCPPADSEWNFGQKSWDCIGVCDVGHGGCPKPLPGPFAYGNMCVACLDTFYGPGGKKTLGFQDVRM